MEGKAKKCSRKSSLEHPGGGNCPAMFGDVGAETGPMRHGPKLRAAHDKQTSAVAAVRHRDLRGDQIGIRTSGSGGVEP